MRFKMTQLPSPPELRLDPRAVTLHFLLSLFTPTRSSSFKHHSEDAGSHPRCVPCELYCSKLLIRLWNDSLPNCSLNATAGLHYAILLNASRLRHPPTACFKSPFPIPTY